MHKKRAQFPPFCTPTLPWYRLITDALRENAPYWAHLHLHAVRKLNSTSIPWERLVSVDANSRLGGFLPAAPKFCGFGPSLPPQNATNYTTLPAHKKPPPKIGRGPPSIHQQPTTAGAASARPSCVTRDARPDADRSAALLLHPCTAATYTLAPHALNGSPRNADALHGVSALEYLQRTEEFCFYRPIAIRA